MPESTPTNQARPKQILRSRTVKIREGGERMSEMNLEFLLGAMPSGNATLYRVLIQLIPAPSAEAPNRGGRQIEMARLAKLTGYTKRWVIELMQRLEDKNFIRTGGGSGAVKWIWLLPPGVLRLGKPYPTKLARRKKTSPGKARAPRAAAPRPKHRPKETAPSPKADAEVNIAPTVDVGSRLRVWRRLLSAAFGYGGRSPRSFRFPRVWCRALRLFLR